MSPLDLVGRWRLDRYVEDRRADVVLTVDGTLVLTADGADRVSWDERGMVHRPGAAPLEGTRRLAVVRRGEGWWVCFDHGGDFHPWTPGTWVDHPCGADRYRGLVEVADDSWSVTWVVSGPAKDYTMRTRLTPDTGPA